MTDCTQESFEFPAVKRRKVEATFSGGEISSDGGVVLLREADRHLGLLEAASRVLHDPRDSGKVVHSQLSLLRQRVYGLCLGYEDLNDHQELRRDPAIQTAVERSEVLASQATLCRLEHRMDRQAAVALHRVLVEQFIASHRKPPRKLILDFDATDDPVHGNQEGQFFHGNLRPNSLFPVPVKYRLIHHQSASESEMNCGTRQFQDGAPIKPGPFWPKIMVKRHPPCLAEGKKNICLAKTLACSRHRRSERDFTRERGLAFTAAGNRQERPPAGTGPQIAPTVDADCAEAVF